MTTLKIGNAGEVQLPARVQERYGITPNSSVRIVETRGGILLVPLTSSSTEDSLARELEEWQALTAESWTQFPYDDEQP
jgi:bifunctional DNA-binding transcriptional regulator/antitoxin component of YhaV-PrlF toxin-antitoxin module